MSTKKIILRTLGVLIGLAFIAMGILMLVVPVYDTFTEKLSMVSQILLGIVFIFYGVTGTDSLNSYIKRFMSK